MVYVHTDDARECQSEFNSRNYDRTYISKSKQNFRVGESALQALNARDTRGVIIQDHAYDRETKEDVFVVEDEETGGCEILHESDLQGSPWLPGQHIKIDLEDTTAIAVFQVTWRAADWINFNVNAQYLYTGRVKIMQKNVVLTEADLSKFMAKDYELGKKIGLRTMYELKFATFLPIKEVTIADGKGGVQRWVHGGVKAVSKEIELFPNEIDGLLERA